MQNAAEKQNGLNDSESCPLAVALDVVGSKWALPIIWNLNRNGTMRFNELRRNLRGVNNYMLTQTLKNLEAHDIIRRVQFNEIPPRVEYSISENGKTLLPLLEDLAEWGRRQMLRKQPHIDNDSE